MTTTIGRTPRRRISVALLLVIIAAWASAGDDASSILNNIRSKYEGIRDAAIHFRQHVKFAVTGAEQTFDGRLVMRKGNRFRIEMDQQTIVTDGSTVWSYTPSTKQVLIDRFREDSRTMTPEKLLVELPKGSTATILGTEKIGGRELTILKLVPNTSSAPWTWMKLWVDTDESTASRIQVNDRAGNLTTYTITELRINKGVPESAFHFSVPAGADSVDLR